MKQRGRKSSAVLTLVTGSQVVERMERIEPATGADHGCGGDLERRWSPTIRPINSASAIGTCCRSIADTPLQQTTFQK